MWIGLGPPLDPGSRPAVRDLAGMTNCNTVSLAEMAFCKERSSVVANKGKNQIFWIKKLKGLKR